MYLETALIVTWAVMAFVVYPYLARRSMARFFTAAGIPDTPEAGIFAEAMTLLIEGVGPDMTKRVVDSLNLWLANACKGVDGVNGDMLDQLDETARANLAREQAGRMVLSKVMSKRAGDIRELLELVSMIKQMGPNNGPGTMGINTTSTISNQQGPY